MFVKYKMRCHILFIMFITEDVISVWMCGCVCVWRKGRRVQFEFIQHSTFDEFLMSDQNPKQLLFLAYKAKIPEEKLFLVIWSIIFS